MNYFAKRAKAAKDQCAQKVLAVLLQTPGDAKTVEELGAETGLGAVVYPLLASLNRADLLEPEWQQRGADRQLAYRLTPRGRNHARRAPSQTTRSSAARGPRLAKPLHSRLAYHISKRFGNL